MTEWRRGAWLAVFLYGLSFPGLPIQAQENLLPILSAYRQHYPTPMSRADVGELLTLTAQSTPGWVLLRKETGNNCPAMGVRVSCDYLVHSASGQGFDVLRDVEGLGVPVWNSGDRFGPERYVYVVTGPPVPDPGTSVPDLGTQIAELEERIRALEGLTQAGFDILVDRLAQQQMTLKSHTQKLESIQAEHSRLITGDTPKKSIWARIFGWLR